MFAMAMAMAMAMAAAPQMAAATPAACATPVAGPPGWAAMAPVTAATVPDSVARATIPVGRSARATLAATPRVRFALAPAKPGGAAQYAGTLAFVAAAAGRYRIALGAGAWVDVVRDGRVVESVAHGHGPACSPVRKTVDFDLLPGRYLIQLSAADAATLPLMVAPVAR